MQSRQPDVINSQSLCYWLIAVPCLVSDWSLAADRSLANGQHPHLITASPGAESAAMTARQQQQQLQRYRQYLDRLPGHFYTEGRIHIS